MARTTHRPLSDGATVRTNGRAPAPVEDRTILLRVGVGTDTERRLIAGWARERHPGAILVDDDDHLDLGRRLAGDANPLVVPVRVTWLPPERDGARNVLARDLLLLTNPRRPWSRLQGRIARRQPDRVRVTAGEPARASELRERFASRSAATGAGALGAFAAQQATIACDRADRAIIGDRYKVPRLVAEQITAAHPFRAKVLELAAQLQRPAD